MFGFVVLLYLTVCLLLSLVLLCRRRYSSIPVVMVVVLALTLMWYLWSPIHFGPISILKSTDRPTINGQELRNWGDTVSCTPTTLLTPQDITEISVAVATAKKLRVVGGGHSWTPLVCSEDTVLTLPCGVPVIRANNATFDAGCSIAAAQQYLMQEEKQLYGYGSIQVQTLAGAFMTALHGVQARSFAADVLEIQAVLANGTVLTTNDIYMWQGSMGMLGVVVRMTFNIYSSKNVQIEERAATIEEVLAAMDNNKFFGMDAKTIWGNTEDVYNLRTFSDPIDKKISLSHPITVESFLHDNIMLPVLLTLSRVVYLLPLASWYYPTYHSKRDDITNAWYRYPEFGFKSAAYSIPLEKCEAAIQEIRQVAKGQLVTVELRFLKDAPGCLSWVQTQSCILDTSFIDASVSNFDRRVQDYHERVEQIVESNNGNPHWGKYYASPYSMLNLPCMDEFKSLRKSLDPSDKFVNAFTEAILTGTSGHYFPSAIQERAYVYRWLQLFAVLVVLFLYVWPSNSQKRVPRFLATQY